MFNLFGKSSVFENWESIKILNQICVREEVKKTSYHYKLMKWTKIQDVISATLAMSHLITLHLVGNFHTNVGNFIQNVGNWVRMLITS